MSIHMERLPRTIALFRAGEASDQVISRAAAQEVAALISSEDIGSDAPVLACLDQRVLPDAVEHLITADWRCVITWICELAVRGAPAIGAAGAAAVALAAFDAAGADEGRAFLQHVQEAAALIGDARPTAVNLMWATQRMVALAEQRVDAGEDARSVACALFDEACAIQREDEEANRRIGEVGAALLPQGCAVLTHCNAGSLATSFYGTALGVVYAAAEQGKLVRVYADETRPVCQGSRLTAWELARAGVSVTLICDDMAASVMAAGEVDAVIVGADRIAANGDVANKIGTLGVAVLARHFGIPFYVAAPTSTIDPDTLTGADIRIEQRSACEVSAHPIEGVDIINPAFDITPADLVTAIITERGAFAPQRALDALG